MRTHVPGVVIPDEIINRLRGVEPERQRAEGKSICIEIIQQIREISHVMAYRQVELVAEIIESAGLLPRRWQYHLNQKTISEEAIR
jgi:methylenetetrahydrofolate reductase (NADPH)